jgi:murein L,D-transpeptidase YcbB/YkuD
MPTANAMPYRLRQAPGPSNALGHVKFMIPNQFEVYLHDTPSRALFAKRQRAFSSGCIRIEQPLALAEYVLRSDPQWPPATIRRAISRQTERPVRLPEPIPVHLVYWTAWVTSDGVTHFRPDVYANDEVLAQALWKHSGGGDRHNPPPPSTTHEEARVR